MSAPPDADRWTEQRMLKALYLYFVEAGWAPLCQVTVPEPNTIGHDGSWTGGSRRIDMLLTRRARESAWCGALERMAIEVKVSRSDFFSDVRKPDKQAAAKWIAHRHTYAVPAGLVQADDVPPDSGLLYMHSVMAGDRPIVVPNWIRPAPLLHTPHAAEWPWVALLYAQRASDADARLNGLTFTAQWKEAGHA